MDRKIKTRQVHKDIKVLDKTVTVTDHVKQSYVRTKENIMQSTEKSSDRENNPVGYAEDAASKYADRIFHETGHQVRRQAGKIIERKKEKASVSSTPVICSRSLAVRHAVAVHTSREHDRGPDTHHEQTDTSRDKQRQANVARLGEVLMDPLPLRVQSARHQRLHSSTQSQESPS